MARAGSHSDRPVIEVADILRRHGHDYARDHAGHLGRVERRVISAITACRTAALGGHVEACDDCGAARIAYNSCRNRHCPKCQGPARAKWLTDRQAELLPVPYFHVVFTLPAPIAAIAFQNKAAVYAILFAWKPPSDSCFVAFLAMLGSSINQPSVARATSPLVANPNSPHSSTLRTRLGDFGGEVRDDEGDRAELCTRR